MKYKEQMKVEYLGLICTVVAVRGEWLELKSEGGMEFLITKDYVKEIRE